MDPEEVPIRNGSIRLGQLLKLASLVDSGSEARPLLRQGAVRVNGTVETRRGHRLQPGDLVEVFARSVRLVDEGSYEDDLPW